MNILNLIAALAGYATAITAVWLLLSKPICIKLIHAEERPVEEKPVVPVPATEEKDTPVSNEEIKTISMDAVIQSVNEMMGVKPIDEEINNDRN